MDKWEYITFAWSGNPINDMLELNQLGKEGWGLIQIVNGIGVMRRKLTNEKKTKEEKGQGETDFETCWKLYRRKVEWKYRSWGYRQALQLKG